MSEEYVTLAFKMRESQLNRIVDKLGLSEDDKSAFISYLKNGIEGNALYWHSDTGPVHANYTLDMWKSGE